LPERIGQGSHRGLGDFLLGKRIQGGGNYDVVSESYRAAVRLLKKASFMLIPHAGWGWYRRGLRSAFQLLRQFVQPPLDSVRLNVLASLEEVPEWIAPRVVFKLKPESFRKQDGKENVID
jgi:hypothetical protein